MNKKDFKYHPLSSDELQDIWKKHKSIIEKFVQYNHYKSENIYINKDAIMAIIAKVHQRKKYFEYFHGLDMSECKEVALICFWYIKLRPICAISKQIADDDAKIFDYINEKLAIYYIIVTLKGMLNSKNISAQTLENIPKSYLKEVLYSFKYRDISKESLILLVETMAVFLGINPYSNKK